MVCYIYSKLLPNHNVGSYFFGLKELSRGKLRVIKKYDLQKKVQIKNPDVEPTVFGSFAPDRLLQSASRLYVMEIQYAFIEGRQTTGSKVEENTLPRQVEIYCLL